MAKSIALLLVCLVAGAWQPAALGQAALGRLVLDVRPFTSEVALKPKIEEQLKSGGIEWGAADGRLVVTLLNKRFVRFDVPQFTRYGESKALDLPAGNYQVSCVGFVPEGGFSVEKALSKGAYFNVDVMGFEIREGETTTLEVQPVIRKASTFFLKFFVPQLVVKVAGREPPDEGTVINDRTDASIGWEDYSGDLKF